MMRIAVLSDIHANMDAFAEVLADLDRTNPDAVYSLGDNIGYGPEPEAVVQALRKRGIPSVLGNHEMAARDPEFLDWFNPVARTSLTMTFGMLSAESLEFIRDLPQHLSLPECRLVHGFPPDSPTTYLFQVPTPEKEKALRQLAEPVCFVGHTHMLEVLGHDGRALLDIDTAFGLNRLDPALKYLVNIGSVGQPRDGDLRAKYVVWDSRECTLDIRCLPYDARRTAAKIRAAGLPEAHARRLLG
jgi:predicted phosphodiesterase